MPKLKELNDSDKKLFVLKNMERIKWNDLRQVMPLPEIIVYLRDSDLFGEFVYEVKYAPYSPKHKGKRRGRFLYFDSLCNSWFSVPDQKMLFEWIDPEHIELLENK